MAKFDRFDPRNKKRGKNKSRSIDKDIRIKETFSKKSFDRKKAIKMVHDDQVTS